jgi:hypothetical protein
LRRGNGDNCLFTGHKRTLATKAQLEKQMAEEAELNERIKFNLAKIKMPGMENKDVRWK